MNIQISHKKSQEGLIQLIGSADDVFALMCPVAEYAWLPGWETDLIITDSGLVEEDCIFTTPAEGLTATWITTHHDLKTRCLTMYKLVPNYAVTRLDIAVRARDEGTEACIVYTHTALSDAAHGMIKAHTAEAYKETMESWQSHINNYLVA